MSDPVIAHPVGLGTAEPGSQVRVLWGEPGRRRTLVRATVRPAPIKKDNRRADLRAMSGDPGSAHGR